MGVNPSNRRLRAAKNLADYGAEGGGFGIGNNGGVGFSIMRFRLFNKIKPDSNSNTGLYDKTLMRFPVSDASNVVQIDFYNPLTTNLRMITHWFFAFRH